MSSKIIFGGLALLLLGGDDGDAAMVPPTPIDPNAPGIPPDVQVFPTSWLPPAVPVIPPDVGIFPGTWEGPGGEEPTPPPAATLGELYDSLLTPTPTQGGLWRVTPGTNPTTALQQAYGEVSAFIWACFTQAAWNWKLYATEGSPGTSYSHPIEGTLGQVTSAWLPMHENVGNAIDFGRLPQRTILWNKGSNGQVQPRGAASLSSPIIGAKTWGTVFFPKLADCAGAWTSQGKSPSALLAMLGTNPADWDAWA